MSQSWTNTTERYRPMSRADLPAVTTMLGDPEVARWLWFTPIEPAGVEAFFGPLLDQQAAQLEAGEQPQTIVFTVEDLQGSFLGQGGIIAVDGSQDGFEIGFQLCTAASGHGVGTRLGSFLCAYAIERLGAYRIEGSCLEGNLASAALLQKLGLTHEGTRPGYRLRDGVRHTELLFGAPVDQLDTGALRTVAQTTGLR